MPQTKEYVAPAPKRRRTANVPKFGAPTEDDATLLQPNQSPSPAALSTCILSQRGSVPSLSSLAARCFVTNIKAISENEQLWACAKRYLKLLPEVLVPRLFSMLRSSCPTLLSHGLIVLYFLRGPSIVLSDDLPGVRSQTIASVTNNVALRELHLIGFNKFADTTFASVLPSLPHLHILVLRGCSKVGAKTAEAIGHACPSLTTLNLNYTSVPCIALLGPLTSCTHLRVLKIAGIPNYTDSHFGKLLTGLGQRTFPHMKNVKFRQLTNISGVSIYDFVTRCPNLTRLDASFTSLHHMPFPSVTLSGLEKLSLTSTGLSCTDTVTLIRSMPNLRTLYLGALGSQWGPSSSIGSISSMMADDTLRLLTDVISRFEHLEKLSLVGNTILGLSASRHDPQGALADVVRRVGRKCKYLNLSGLPHLRSSDLGGLSDVEHGGPCRLEHVALNNTGIDDGAAEFLACCPSLSVLEVSGTKLTSAGLFPILDACPKLEKLDLTSCRGIKVTDRRRFFEVWESEWKDT